jgi:hypothetical protein
MSLIRWLLCLTTGHVYSEWVPSVWVHETYSWQPSDAHLTSNMREEIRFCLRCSAGYQGRFAP